MYYDIGIDFSSFANNKVVYFEGNSRACFADNKGYSVVGFVVGSVGTVVGVEVGSFVSVAVGYFVGVALGSFAAGSFIAVGVGASLFHLFCCVYIKYNIYIYI